MPFTVLRHLEGRAAFLFENVNGVILTGVGSGEVLRTVIVDQVERSRFAVFYLGRGDYPAIGLVLLTEIAGQRAIELLTWHFDVFVVEVDAQVDIILIII